MKRILSFITLLFAGLVLNAQIPSPTMHWAKSVNGISGDAIPMSVTTDLSGNVYTTGYIGGTVDFDPGPGVFNLSSGMFILKLDAFGNFVWAKHFFDGAYVNGNSIFLDPAGNIYTTGDFQMTTDFDPGAAVYNLTSFGGADVFLLKLDSAGDFVWVKQMGGFGDESGNSIAIDAAGNIFSSGNFLDTADFDPGAGVVDLYAGSNILDANMYISKLDASGNFLWAKGWGGQYEDEVRGISLDSTGSVYAVGGFQDTADFDPGPGVNNLTSFGQDAFLLKLDASGNFAWAKKMGAGTSWGFTVKVDRFDNVYTSGNIGSANGDFDPGAGVFTLESDSGDVFVLKVDYLGNFIWAKNMASGGHVESIALDTSSNIYMVGEFYGTADMDPGLGVSSLSNIGSNDIFVSKLDASGNFLWAKQFVGGPGNDGGIGIALDAAENIYTTGIYVDTVDFDPSPGVFNLTPVFPGWLGYNMFVHKLIGTNTVWPGDANHDNVADNNDFLPIGVFYGATGSPRATINNSWLEYAATDWNTLQGNGADIKHADCNGDGMIDANDTLAINLNFALTHAFVPANNELRISTSDLHLVTVSGTYLSGSVVDVEVWLGDASAPLFNGYGIAFDLSYDASLVQPGTESLTYPISWLGNPGTDVLRIGKVDASANTAFGATTRIVHTNASGYGKIANFKFQLKSSIPANTPMIFSISGYAANDSAGSPIFFNTPKDTILINSTSAVNELNKDSQISVYPNPTSGSFSVFTSEMISDGTIEVYNIIGALVLNAKMEGRQSIIDLKDLANGIYFVKMTGDGKIIGTKKLIKQ